MRKILDTTLFAAGDFRGRLLPAGARPSQSHHNFASGRRADLGHSRPGEIAGELSIIDRQPRSTSVVAVKNCELSSISQKSFEKCTKQDPDIYRYLVNVLALRLRETDDAVAADSFLTVKAPRALLELTEYLGEDAGAGRVLIRHKISQSDLAAMAGTARKREQGLERLEATQLSGPLVGLLLPQSVKGGLRP